MKRSEMVEKINELICLNLATLQEVPDASLFSSFLLHMQEESGMLPPSYLYQDGDIGSCFKNEWEPEDE